MTSRRITREEWALMVTAYRDGVPGASDRLWRASLRLVPRILALRVHPELTLRQALAGVEREDLDQHVALEILIAAQSYDSQKGSWTTWVTRRLHGRLRHLARRQRRWDAAAAVTSSLDEVVDDDGDDATWHDRVASPGPSPEEVASRKEALSHYLRCEKSKRA
jgi:DNA-directed RNA polymerase specialized sigma24 family protein